MDTFQNISVTLPHEKNRQQIFYSTSKKWGRDNPTSEHDFTKDTFLRQLSSSTKKNKTVANYDYRVQTMKLEHQLSQKNQLLIKQSKWKNYYLKEEIYVLTQDILEYLNLIGSEISENSYFYQYARKLQKIISKVQFKKKTQKNWIDFLGIQEKQTFKNDKLSFEQKTVQTQEVQNSNLQNSDQESGLEIQKNLILIQEENKKLSKSLNILTQQIQNKHKQILYWQQKYSKQKLKRDKLKDQYVHLEAKLEEFLITRKENRKIQFYHQNDLQKTENFSKKKPNKAVNHLHTYSLDRNQLTAKSKFMLHSEENGEKIEEEEGSNLFVLSDTPFMQQKNKQIPISSGFIETRKKLEMPQNPQESKYRKSISIITNKSGEKTVSLMEKKLPENLELGKKNKTQNEKIDSVDQVDLPTNSLIYDSQIGETDMFRQLLLSQALTIENLLQSI